MTRKQGQTYLYNITAGEDGKPSWESLGNVNKLDMKDPEIKKALKQTQIAAACSKAGQIVEWFYKGEIDKAKARA